MGFEVVHGVKGFVPEDGESAGGEGADEERAEEAGGVGDGDIIDVVFGEVGVSKGLVDDGEDGFEVGASGDFGNDAAVGSKNIDLGDDDVAEDAGLVCDDGGGGFVAGGFDSENIHIIYIIP